MYVGSCCSGSVVLSTKETGRILSKSSKVTVSDDCKASLILSMASSYRCECGLGFGGCSCFISFLCSGSAGFWGCGLVFSGVGFVSVFVKAFRKSSVFWVSLGNFSADFFFSGRGGCFLVGSENALAKSGSRLLVKMSSREIFSSSFKLSISKAFSKSKSLSAGLGNSLDLFCV